MIEVLREGGRAARREPAGHRHRVLQGPELEHRHVEPLAVEGHDRRAREPVPGAREELRLVLPAIRPGREIGHSHDAALLDRLEEAGGHGAVVGERQEVAAAAGAGAALGEDPPELLRVRPRRLAVHRGDEGLVRHRLEIERHVPSHARESGSPV
jgi:hypothetical protein